MPTQVDAYQVALLVEALEVAPPFKDVGRLRLGNLHRFHAAEEAVGVLLVVLLEVYTVGHEHIEEHRPTAVDRKVLLAAELRKTVERTGNDQRFAVLAVAGVEVDALKEVVDIGEASLSLALVDDGLNGVFAHAFDGGETETDVAHTVDGKLEVALVDIGAVAIYLHVPTLVEKFGQIADVTQRTTEQAGHILRREVGLQVGRLIGYPRVARGVTLVEGIFGKGSPVVPNLFQHLRIVAVGLPAGHKLGVHVVELVAELFTHGFAEVVALAAGEVGNLA